MPDENQNNFIQLIAFFLAEIIRSRRTSIRRAAEISSEVVNHLDTLVSESATLAWAEQIEKDFEELAILKQALHFDFNKSDIEVYEQEIKDYAAMLVQSDLTLSTAFLKDAADRSMNIQKICVKYPDFCYYLVTKTDKAPLLPELQAAI